MFIVSTENSFAQSFKTDSFVKKGWIFQSESELSLPILQFPAEINDTILAQQNSQQKPYAQIESIEKHLENNQLNKEHEHIVTHPTQNTALDQAQEKAKKIKSRLNNATSDLKSITKTETKILSQLNDTERLLNQIRNEITLNHAELTKIDNKIKNHLKNQRQFEEKIIDREAYIAKRMVALYKLSLLGQLPILATAGSGIDFLKRKASLEYILNDDQLKFDQLQKEKKRLKQMLVKLNTQQSEKKKIEAQLLDQKKMLTTQIEKRNQLLTQVKNRKELQLAAISELEQAADKLDQAISALSETTLDSTDTVSSSAKDFSKFKGLLNLPVKGKIIYFYGPYKNRKFDVVNFRTGITIQADRGEPIHSVGSGVIIYANWFRGYGNMIIIDHGNRYYTVYAHLEEFFKSNGDRVEVDEVIATVGDTGSMGGAGLHFEVRHHGKPLDPMKWIRKG